MTIDYRALLRLAERCQAETLGLLADYAADVGDAALEAGYRWLAGRGRWPQIVDDRDGPKRLVYWSRAIDFPTRADPPRTWPPGALPGGMSETWNERWESVGPALDWAARKAGAWLQTPEGKQDEESTQEGRR